MDQEKFALIQRALAEPKRLELLEAIRERASCEGVACSTVLDAMSISQSTFSHHVSELTKAGLVEGRKDGRFTLLTVNEATVHEYLEELRKKMLGTGNG